MAAGQSVGAPHVVAVSADTADGFDDHGPCRSILSPVRCCGATRLLRMKGLDRQMISIDARTTGNRLRTSTGGVGRQNLVAVRPIRRSRRSVDRDRIAPAGSRRSSGHASAASTASTFTDDHSTRAPNKPNN